MKDRIGGQCSTSLDDAELTDRKPEDKRTFGTTRHRDVRVWSGLSRPSNVGHLNPSWRQSGLMILSFSKYTRTYKYEFSSSVQNNRPSLDTLI
jgi:hypothetical protein